MNDKVSFSKSEIVFYILLALFILFSRYLYCFANVSGSSMSPTFEDGDYLFVSKYSTVSNGDIVIINKKGVTGYLVKRVIAVSGDKLELSDSNVLVNDEVLDEDYINTSEEVHYNSISQVISSDSYFVLGDNRNHSGDSREFGEVSKSEIVGVVKFNLSIFGISQTKIRVCLLLSSLLCMFLYLKLKKKVYDFK